MLPDINDNNMQFSNRFSFSDTHKYQQWAERLNELNYYLAFNHYWITLSRLGCIHAFILVKPKDSAGQPREWTADELKTMDMVQKARQEGKTLMVVKTRIGPKIISV